VSFLGPETLKHQCVMRKNQVPPIVTWEKVMPVKTDGGQEKIWKLVSEMG
jgi:hypothetical protein